MKLRLRTNSIRLRLTKGEVERVAGTGRVEEAVGFDTGARSILTYALVSGSDAAGIYAEMNGLVITVSVPETCLKVWAETDRTAIEADQQIGDGQVSRILVEKDFSCLEPRAGDDDADTFPHPQATRSSESSPTA